MLQGLEKDRPGAAAAGQQVRYLAVHNFAHDFGPACQQAGLRNLHGDVRLYESWERVNATQCATLHYIFLQTVKWA